MNTINSIRPSPIAGSWYSSNAKSLSTEIKGYLDSATLPEINSRLIGVISPHAGYFYSGSTAGYAYRVVQGHQYDLCVVVSPLHAYLPLPLLSSAHTAYATPLGNIEIDHELMDEFSQQLSNKSLPTPQLISNDREHSLEIQLPFLQTALSGSFRLLPLMVRSDDAEILKNIAEVLAKAITERNVLLVASTDLSHFYDEKTANKLDKVMLKRMTDLSPAGVLQAEANQQGFACGAGAVALVLWTAKKLGADRVTLLNHNTSAQASGDTSSVVGYGALAITKQEGI
jgi:MEMO1 family protein